MSENEESATRDVYKAALTPEEWAECDRQLAFQTAAELVDQAWFGSGNGNPRHAAAALCLHGQPFGFTHEDVRNLRQLAADMREAASAAHYLGESDESKALWEMNASVCEQRAGQITSIADRITALLPPEAP